MEKRLPHGEARGEACEDGGFGFGDHTKTLHAHRAGIDAPTPFDIRCRFSVNPQPQRSCVRCQHCDRRAPDSVINLRHVSASRGAAATIGY